MLPFYSKRLVFNEILSEHYGTVHRLGEIDRIAYNMCSIAFDWTYVQAVNWIETASFQNTLGFRAGIFTPTRDLIGCFGLGKEKGVTSANLMYFLSPDVWGQGYATEAVHAITKMAADVYWLSTIDAEVLKDNPASAKVLINNRFIPIGQHQVQSPARVEPSAVTLYRLHV